MAIQKTQSVYWAIVNLRGRFYHF